MSGKPSEALLLNAWECASIEPPVRRPLTVLSMLVGRERNELQTLTVGERDLLVLQLRSRLFGPQIVCITTCPACRVQGELAFLIEDLTANAPIQRQVAISLDDTTLTARPLTAGDLEEAATSDNVRIALFRKSITEPVTQKITDKLLAQVGTALAEADPFSNIELATTCPGCQQTVKNRFDPWAFLWEEIHAWAMKTLTQIHRLARAYGWREDDILALSPARRATYLKLVET